MCSAARCHAAPHSIPHNVRIRILIPTQRTASGVKEPSAILQEQFLPREAMLSAVFAVVVCLSVCLCVCHTPVLYQNGYTYDHANNAA